MSDWQAVDENLLIAAAQDGNAEAFGELYERYATVIFRFLYTHLDDRLDAEDLTEDVFFRAWRSMPRYREQGVPFLAYLYRIARNALVDHYRRSSSQNKQVQIGETEISAIEQAEPGDALTQQLEHREVREVMGQLRDDYRTVLALRFVNDFSPEETAQTMGKSAGAVRVLQHRALAALRKLINSKV